jgi:hypothetical protein
MDKWIALTKSYETAIIFIHFIGRYIRPVENGTQYDTAARDCFVSLKIFGTIGCFSSQSYGSLFCDSFCKKRISIATETNIFQFFDMRKHPTS